MRPVRIAIVHDYLNQMGGAERVVAVMHSMFPEAPVYTTIANRSILQDGLENADVRTTWMQRIPGIQKRFKWFFWLYPFAVASMKLDAYDLVISSSSAFAKGAPVANNAVHVCYCHAPMRFAWNFDGYMDGMKVPEPVKWIAKKMMLLLKRWDRRTAEQVDYLIANSTEVKERIKRFYDREPDIIFPPVNVSRFPSEQLPDDQTGDYFLIVSRLVSYKKIDLAVEACTRLSIPLVVIGDGPDRRRLEAMAGPTVTFRGRLPDGKVTEALRRCQALLFPGLEDFGITPLEANACGRPVIAYQAGGALDTIANGQNGLFFAEQTAESLGVALLRFTGCSWDPEMIRAHAEQFGTERFKAELMRVVDQAVAALAVKHPAPAATIYPTTQRNAGGT